ncbi:MAG: hypothetical protein PWQ15_271 [Methanobacterium sp.]|jgi:DNA-binding transcriptional regulator GbsR (MarR family)|uniref:GbsR/MarR family transcriptional regulator n=1 Tax=Methanobacterium sp. TaxID=2164 RepID=UPI0003C9EED3|nr:MarR family transcriptional regulator [Methanobacterium sp.]MDI3549169.1 hypothetical protein [Methanobacterium sp.]CDG64370.1 hypothetical protein MBMB1_0258 [Methanobacterium sp. MB1]
MTESPKEDFKKSIYNSFKALGVDDFPSVLMSVLQSESNEISLSELSEMTGYSLSAVSTAIKGMEDQGLVKRFKKPKSRKIYVIMDKDLVTLYTKLQEKRYQQALMPFLKDLKRLVDKYDNNKEFTHETSILKDFQEQVTFIEEATRKYIETLEKWRDIKG